MHSVILIFVCYFKLTCCLLDDCLFLTGLFHGAKNLALNKHFSSNLSGSHFLSSSVSHIYSLHLPSAFSSLIPVSPFCPSNPTFILFLHVSSLLSPSCLFSLNFLFCTFPPFTLPLVFYFAIFSCYPVLPHSTHPTQSASREVLENKIQGIPTATEP